MKIIDVPKGFQFHNPIHLLAFGFGSGLAAVAPGTWGTAVAIPLFLLVPDFLPLVTYAILVLLISAQGIYLCGKTAKDLGVHDHGGIVWDEIAGYFVTMLPVFPTGDWRLIVAGFVLFRLFDIVKPWPIKWLDKHVHGGLGIMVDDLLAGVFAGACLFALNLWVL